MYNQQSPTFLLLVYTTFYLLLHAPYWFSSFALSFFIFHCSCMCCPQATIPRGGFALIVGCRCCSSSGLSLSQHGSLMATVPQQSHCHHLGSPRAQECSCPDMGHLQPESFRVVSNLERVGSFQDSICIHALSCLLTNIFSAMSFLEHLPLHVSNSIQSIASLSGLLVFLKNE